MLEENWYPLSNINKIWNCCLDKVKENKNQEGKNQ